MEALAVESTEKPKQNSGSRKWFKRSSGDKKEKKKRSGSIFARLCGINKKKNKDRPAPKDEPENDQLDQNREVGDIGPPEETVESVNDETAPEPDDESKSFPESSTDTTDRSNFEELVEEVQVIAAAEVEADAATAVKQDWIDFGKSLGIGDQEMAEMAEKIVAEEVVEKKKTEEEEELEIRRVVDEAPPLALQSSSVVDHDFPRFMPVGTKWDASKCRPVPIWVHEKEDKESDADPTPVRKKISIMVNPAVDNESVKSKTVDDPKSSTSASSFFSATACSVPCLSAISVTVPAGNETEKTSPSDRVVCAMSAAPSSEMFEGNVTLVSVIQWMPNRDQNGSVVVGEEEAKVGVIEKV